LEIKGENMKSRLSIATFLLVTVCSGTSIAKQNPAKIQISAESKDAAIVIKLPSAPAPYEVNFTPYDIEKEQLTGLFRGLQISVSEEDFEKQIDSKARFFSHKIKPGTYVLQLISQQGGTWGVCFFESTQAFTVSAGQVLYLGELNSDAHVRQLLQLALAKGQTSAPQGTVYNYFDGIISPTLSTENASVDLPNAIEFVKESMPKTSVKPIAAKILPARFGTGYTLFGQRVCGGYFAKSAKKSSPKDSSSVSDAPVAQNKEQSNDEATSAQPK
jgi:hypothetical protein